MVSPDVTADREFRYCVVPNEDGLDLSDSTGDRCGWVEEQEWSSAAPLIFSAGGQALMWLDHAQDQKRREESDPLTDWYRTATLWGTGVKADLEDLFQLVRPGQAGEATPLTTVDDEKHENLQKRLEAETEAFAEEAFVFPTGTEATDERTGQWQKQVRRPDSDPAPTYIETATVDGLTLHIIPRYLPQQGTLMVDGEIEVVPPDVTIPNPSVQCAVHYVSVGEHFRYKVMPVGEDGKAHPLQVNPERPLEHQIDSTWGESTEKTVTREVEIPVTRVSGMGTPMPAHTWKTGETRTVQVEEEEAQVLEIPLVDGPTPEPPEPISHTEKDEGESQMQVLKPEEVFTPRAAEAISTRAEPPPKPLEEQTLAVSGLTEILETSAQRGGRIERNGKAGAYAYEGPSFRVTGEVCFRPDQPVDPTPDVRGVDDQPYVSRDRIEFSYPLDVVKDAAVSFRQ